MNHTETLMMTPLVPLERSRQAESNDTKKGRQW
jgi:hypothetical protein